MTHHNAYQFRDFYRSLNGRIVRRLIRERILKLWPDIKGLKVMGGGYAVPYLRCFEDGAERCLAVMFSGQGVHHWPEDAANLTCLCDEAGLPFETNSLDRIILVHALEFSGLVTPAFEEFWRVLKSNGRLLIIVPNRMGLWCRADWSPFVHGRPYSTKQVNDFLRNHLFVPERAEKGLFIPPFETNFLLRSAGWWESVGEKICPGMGGLLFVEASKQIYAGLTIPATRSSRLAAGLKHPKPVLQPQNMDHGHGC